MAGILKMLNYLKSEDGAALAEYALILAVLGAGLAVALVNFRTAAQSAVQGAATTVASGVVTGGSSGSSGDTNSTNSTNSTGGNCHPKKNC
jgi:pilus assembly protein Flp/PilA